MNNILLKVVGIYYDSHMTSALNLRSYLNWSILSGGLLILEPKLMSINLGEYLENITNEWEGRKPTW